MAYNSLSNNSDFLVQARAATVFAAFESSLFLGGSLIPVVNAPNGLLKVPKISGGAATTIAGGSADSTGDISAVAVTANGVNIVANLYAARSVVRDLGAIDPNEVGRQLGNTITNAFDAAVVAAIEGVDAADAGDDILADIFAGVGAIRAAGETGQLFGLVSADQYAAVMAKIGSQAYAGGEAFQGQALRSGLLGAIAGVPMFVTSKMDTGLAICGMEGLRIAMQKNVDVEIARRAEAVGNDVVASIHAGVGVVDAARIYRVSYAA